MTYRKLVHCRSISRLRCTLMTIPCEFVFKLGKSDSIDSFNSFLVRDIFSGGKKSQRLICSLSVLSLNRSSERNASRLLFD